MSAYRASAASIVPRLTKEQAAIVSSYTGFLCGDFSDMQEYVERKLGRPVWTHEFASEAMTTAIREATKEDFVALVPEGCMQGKRAR